MSSPSHPHPDASDRALVISVFEGSLHALMLGVTESYLGAFAVELGHGAERLAVLATVPLFLGALSQLFSGAVSRAIGRKRLAVLGAFLQALSQLGFVAIALTNDTRLGTLLAVKVVFWISGSLMAPAWSDWIAQLTRRVSRQRYFARRSAIIHVCLLTAFSLAGFALHHAGEQRMNTYAALFGVGALARLASSAALAAQADPDGRTIPLDPSSAWQRTRAALLQSRFRVAGYLALLMFGASIAIPFFTPYMLHELDLDYGSFAFLSAISILTKALVYPLFHKLSERLGLPRMLKLAGIGVAAIPLLWALSPRFEALLLVHVVSGAAWAGLEYASFQLLMKESSAELRTEFFSLSNSLSGLLQVLGAVTGGLLLRTSLAEYTDVFLLSSLLRALPLLLLLAALPRLRLPRRLRALPMRLFSVRPSAGAAQKPILPARGGKRRPPE